MGRKSNKVIVDTTTILCVNTRKYFNISKKTFNFCFNSKKIKTTE